MQEDQEANVMHEGQEVHIFKDALTRQSFDGLATLQQYIDTVGKFEEMEIQLWAVKFMGEMVSCPRRILVTENLKCGGKE